ncbi:MAG TPA: prolyl oligopeptidase family serine peptidase [Caldilineaceae bacterium]|nr:prolyl oligopeptidase family serine peptidase [Caldilineaceae bacterium]
MKQTAYTYVDRAAGNLRLRYLLYLPNGYYEETERRWPLVLFLHGRGERGDDVNLVRRYGLPVRLDADDNFPFIAMSPQCPLSHEWPNLVGTLGRLVDDAVANLPVDPTRVYLTGLSMGARGGWLLAVEKPERFAAAALICGRIPTSDFLERVLVLKDKPLWIFHGAKDPVVPVENSEQIVATLKAAGGDPKLTIYPDADHDSWTAAYGTPDLYSWLLAQRNG